MKHISLIISILIASSLSAQITIGTADMPNPGDTLRKSQSLNPDVFNFSETGENYIWNYEDLVPLKQVVDTFQTLDDVAFIYKITFFGSANLAHPLEGGPTGSDTIINSPYEFFNNTSSVYEQAGGGFSIGESPIPIKFDSPDKLFTFPMQYGNTHSSYSSYEQSLPGFGYMGGWKQRDAEVDGYGSLITPFGEFDVLRLHATVNQYDSIYMESQGFGFPVYQDYDEYYWMGQGQGVPLLYVREGGSGGSLAVYRDSIRDLSVGIQEEEAIFNQVFPNPAKNQITITNIHSFKKLEITNFNGQSIYETSDNSLLVNHNLYLNIERLGMKPGVYFLHVITQNSKRVLKLLVE